MSYPVLYAPNETNFDHNGIGVLGDAISCIVTEEANGEFELEIEYPINGIHYAEIVDRCIIKAKSNQDANPQLFRVYSISKPMIGSVRISAQHISYDLTDIPVSRFVAENASSAMTGLLTNAVIDCPFIFRTDKATIAQFAVSVPGSIRSKLGGSAGSILDVYGGEFEFDNFDVILHASRGTDRGVSIRYGKNLTDLKQDRNCASIATGVYPYWVNAESGNVVELPEKIVMADGTYNFEKIRTLDISGVFQEEPTEGQIRNYTKSYIKSNHIGIPSVSMSVSFKQLEQSEEYKGMDSLEKVSLFDTVNVEFPALGVSANAKAVKIVYNALLDRVENITLGSVKAKITDTIANQQQQISQAPTKDDVQRASALATAWLTNGKGYKVERRDENGSTVDTIYMDTPDIGTAVNVLRIGQSGIGFSRNGVNGPYYSAWTLDGNFIADNITTGRIKSKDGNTFFDVDSGEIIVGDANGGKTSIYDGQIATANANGSASTNLRGGALTFWGENKRTLIEITPKLGSGISTMDPAITFHSPESGSVTAKFISGPAFEISLPDYDTMEKVNKIAMWKANSDGTYTLIGR